MLDKINYIEVDFIEAFNEWFFNNKTIVCMTGKMKCEWTGGQNTKKNISPAQIVSGKWYIKIK